jgi:ketohexokinase
LVLGWGAAGAWFMEPGSPPRQVPARRVERLVDTLGAGDVLNAGVIDARLRGLDPLAAVRHGVRLAGLKCAREGLDGLAAALAHGDAR